MAKKNPLSIDEKLANIDNNPRLNRIAERKYKTVERKTERAAGDSAKLAKINNKYGYDYNTANRFNIKPDSTGHMPSVADNGQILKAKKHPTIKKTIQTEKVLGNKMFNVKGKTYTAPKSEAREYKNELKMELSAGNKKLKK